MRTVTQSKCTPVPWRTSVASSLRPRKATRKDRSLRRKCAPPPDTTDSTLVPRREPGDVGSFTLFHLSGNGHNSVKSSSARACVPGRHRTSSKHFVEYSRAAPCIAGVSWIITCPRSTGSRVQTNQGEQRKHGVEYRGAAGADRPEFAAARAQRRAAETG